MDPQRIAEVDPGPSGSSLALGAAVGIAILSGLLAGLAGPPYLSLSSLSPWIVVFAAATFAALFAVPFAANRLLVARRPERAEAWEAAMLAWGAVALGALGAGGLLIWAGDFSPARSLADAIGLLLAIEAGMVVLALIGWMVSS